MTGHNFTERTHKILAMARDEAARLRHEYIGTEHILLGLAREGGSLGAAVLQNLGADLDALRRQVDATVARGTHDVRVNADLPYTSRSKKVLELAVSEARDLHHFYVGTEHLLLGLVREGTGIAAQLLADAGVTTESARAEVLRLLGSPPAPPPTN